MKSILPQFQLEEVLAEPGPLLMVAKVVGAVLGSLISLAYILPQGRREALLRFTVGVVVGVVFGTTAGLKIADFLGVLGRVTLIEITVMGATLASVSAWWGLGALQRLVERYQLSAPRKWVSKGRTD